jgi:hypothetical protein
MKSQNVKINPAVDPSVLAGVEVGEEGEVLEALALAFPKELADATLMICAHVESM